MKRAWKPLLVAAIPLLISFAIFLPFFRIHETTIIGGNSVDILGTLWYQWFIKKTLFNFELPIVTQYFHHPYGKDLLLHTGGNFIDAYLSIPFQLLLPWPSYYNFFCLSVLLLIFFSSFFTFSSFIKSFEGTLLASILFTFSALNFYYLIQGQITQSFLIFLPPFFLVLKRMKDRPSFLLSIILSLLLLLNSLVYWYYGFFLAFYSTLFLLFHIRTGEGGHRVFDLPFFKRFSAFVLLSFILALPFIVVFVKNFFSSRNIPGLEFIVSLSPADYEVEFPISGIKYNFATFSPFTTTMGLTIGGAGIFPISLILLFLFSLIYIGKDRIFYTISILFFILLSFGPYIAYGEEFFPNYFYIIFYKYVPFFSRLWFPIRALTPAMFLITLCIGFGVRDLFERFSISRGVKILFLSSILLTFFTELCERGFLPLHRSNMDVHPYYYHLKGMEGEALIDLPFGVFQGIIFYQTIHEKKILGGMPETRSSFYTPNFKLFLQGNTFLKYLIGVGRNPSLRLKVRERDMDAVTKLGYRYVVVHYPFYEYTSVVPSKKWPDMEIFRIELEKRVGELLGTPIFEDDEITVYRIDGGDKGMGNGKGSLMGAE